MAKQLMLTIALLIVSIHLSFSQDYIEPLRLKPQNSLSEFRDQMHKIISDSKLPYRDYHFSYNIHYDTLSSQYRFSTVEKAIQETIGKKMDSLIQASDLQDIDSFHARYRGTVRFDNYTDQVFVHVEYDGTINVFKVDAKPEGGIESFAKRWVAYLDSLQNIGDPLLADMTAQNETWIPIMIERDGSLIPIDTIPNGILDFFLSRETQKWWPNILSGRPFPSVMRLRIPPAQKRVSWKNMFRIDKLAYTIDDKKIFVAEDIKDISNNTNVPSTIFYEGEYVAPILHRGHPEELKWLVGKLQDKTTHNKRSYGRYYYERLYFYTDVDE